MKIAFYMDPLESLIKLDTTLLMMSHMLKKGHEVFFFHPNSLTLSGESEPIISQYFQLLEFDHEKILVSKKQEFLSPLNLNHQVDKVIVRRNPPFDQDYFTDMSILDLCSKPVINKPSLIINYTEKISCLKLFPELSPPTLITQNIKEAQEFHALHKKTIIKPLYHMSGIQIKIIEKPQDITNPNKPHDTQKFIIQKYFTPEENLYERLLLLEGKIINRQHRILQSSTGLHNMCFIDLKDVKKYIKLLDPQACTDSQKYAISKIASLGFTIASIEFIGPYIIDINVTSNGFALENLYLDNSIIDKVIESLTK